MATPHSGVCHGLCYKMIYTAIIKGYLIMSNTNKDTFINYKNRLLQNSGIVYKCATSNSSFWRAKERICCSCSHMSGLGNQKIIAAFRRSPIKERTRKIQRGTGTLVGQS